LHVFSAQLQGDIQDLSPIQRDLAENAKVPLEVRAGDVTIHHCLTLHGSFPNTRSRLRKNIVTHLFSSDCRLVRARLPRGAEVWFESDGQDHLTGDSFPELYAKNSRPANEIITAFQFKKIRAPKTPP
jgi:hypothetical protein